MTKTYSFKVLSERMEEHLDSQKSTSEYLRSLVEQDMLTQAEEIERQINEVEEELEELSGREEELRERKEELREQHESAQEVQDEVSMDLLDFVENLITIEPDMRDRNIRKTVRNNIPEISPDELLQALDGIDIHHVTSSGTVQGETFKEEFESAGFESDEHSSLGRIVVEEGTEAYDFATSLTPREEEELREALPQYV